MADEAKQAIELTPIDLGDTVLGRYAAFDVTAEEMYDKDGLGEDIANAIEEMAKTMTMADSAARIFEVLQRWEARLFERGYQFLVAGGLSGWSLAGASSKAGALAWSNANELFALNVYGARRDKIVAAMTRECPTTEFFPVDPESPADQTATDAANKYKHLWSKDNDVQCMIELIAGLFYTDDRIALVTYSVADAQRFGSEPRVKERAFGEDQAEGVAPETEMPGDGEEAGTDPPAATEEPDTDQPGVKEITEVYGVLENRVPLLSDDISDMPYFSVDKEIDSSLAKAKYPWIEDKIGGGAAGKGNEQYDRLARMNTRLAIKNSTVTGESWKRDVTEGKKWFRPCMYFDVKDKDVRQAMFNNFPKGIHARFIGSDLAFARNESMDDHCVVGHARPGQGQNRRPIGANYLPAQKILNTWVSLMNRFFVACVPHKYAAEGRINVDAMNAQQNDPAIVTKVLLETGERIEDLFGVEPTPTPQAGMQAAITYFMDGLPEIMDGASPAMFGNDTGTDTVGGIRINKDQALAVFGTPWGAMCMAIAKAQRQAVVCAAENRTKDINSIVPGQGRLKVEIANLKGNVLCYPEADSGFPESWAEKEARVAAMVEAAAAPGSPYQAVLSYPKNALALKQFLPPGMEIPGADSVEKQQGEFEILLTQAPTDNPEYMMAQNMIEQLKASPEAQDPQGQQMLQQAEQAIGQMPQQLTSVAVAADASEDHETESSVCFAWINSSEGRKYKNGNPQQKKSFSNVYLHWQGHEQMKQKLQPVPQIPLKVNGTIALDKLPPDVASQAFQALGITAPPESFKDDNSLEPHEIIQETEGQNASGARVKQRVAIMKPQ